ncbi:hypothetical protein [Sphingomonas solaris]|nr:hypothetical protein [Sphingomonas solaris]
MAHDGGASRLRRRGAIMLAGLLAGLASAALLNAALDLRPVAPSGMHTTI